MAWWWYVVIYLVLWCLTDLLVKPLKNAAQNALIFGPVCWALYKWQPVPGMIVVICMLAAAAVVSTIIPSRRGFLYHLSLAAIGVSAFAYYEAFVDRHTDVKTAVIELWNLGPLGIAVILGFAVVIALLSAAGGVAQNRVVDNITGTKKTTFDS